jgi:hypothetical protein
MNTNQYEHWEANDHLPDSFFLNKLHYEDGALIVSFKEFGSTEQRELKVSFKHHLAYRVVSESGRLKSLDNVSLKQFCKTENSEFIAWFKDEALGIYDDRRLIHYAIVNLDNIVDIISEYPPTVEWI